MNNPGERMPTELWAFSFWGVLIGAPLSVVMVVLTIFTQGIIADIIQLPSAAPSGPSLFEGTLARPEGPSRTHLGADVAGWVGEIRSVVSHGKSNTRSTLCSVGHLEGMTLVLAGNSASFRLEIPDYHVNEGHLDLFTSVVKRHSAQRLVRGDVVEQREIPAAMLSGCALAPLLRRETRTYVEHQLPIGARVTFLGCRQGDSLGACPGDRLGAGHLLRGTRADLLGDLLMTSVVMHGFITFIAVCFSFIAGWTVWTHLRRYQRLETRPW